MPAHPVFVCLMREGLISFYNNLGRLLAFLVTHGNKTAAGSAINDGKASF